MVKSITTLIITYTVKPVYNGHPWDLKKRPLTEVSDKIEIKTGHW